MTMDPDPETDVIQLDLEARARNKLPVSGHSSVRKGVAP